MSDPDTIRDSAVFAAALMAILGAHEFGHWVVARRHGFALSLPYFIPFPIMAFGTLGAIIRLRSEPQSRTALLEMGAAGPIAGLLVAVVCMALGLPGTQEVVDIGAPGAEVLIFGNPLLMDLLGAWTLGAPPGRFDVLTPLALAAWIGCLLTCMNLLPIGQLDGGHIVTALWPRHAVVVGRVSIGVLFVLGTVWVGWAVWAGFLLLMRAHRGLDVPESPVLTGRARMVAVMAAISLGLTFMPAPIQTDVLPEVRVEEVPL